MTTTPSLFRPEAVAQQRLRLWGEVGVRMPFGTAALTLLVLVIVGVVLAYLALGEYNRKERVRGVLRGGAGALLVHAAAPGVIEAVLVRPGSVVRAGQALVRLRSGSLLPDGSAPDTRLLQALDAQLAALGDEDQRETARDAVAVARLQARGTSLERERADWRDTRDRQRVLLAIANEQLERMQRLAATGQIAVAQLRAAQADALQRAQTLADAEQQLHGREAALVDARLELRQAPLDAAGRHAALIQRRSELAQRRIDIVGSGSTTVAAPVTGRVSQLYVDIGEHVQRDHALLSMGSAPGGLEAVLLMPSRAAGFVRAGQPVRLRYDAFPYQRFGSYAAVVTSVDLALQSPADVGLPIAVQEPVLRVRAALQAQLVSAYGSRLPLRPGLGFEADVVLEKRTLLQWLLDPLRAQLGR